MIFFKDAKAMFGSYVEASRDDKITNDMKSRTDPCLALGPSGNLQGSVKCFDLKTGRILIRRTVTSMPVPDSLVKVVNA